MALFSFRQAELFFLGGAAAPPAPLGRSPVMPTKQGTRYASDHNISLGMGRMRHSAGRHDAGANLVREFS